MQTFFATTAYAAIPYSGTYSGCYKNVPLNDRFFTTTYTNLGYFGTYF
jgi:hypothetical protein